MNLCKGKLIIVGLGLVFVAGMMIGCAGMNFDDEVVWEEYSNEYFSMQYPEYLGVEDVMLSNTFEFLFYKDDISEIKYTNSGRFYDYVFGGAVIFDITKEEFLKLRRIFKKGRKKMNGWS